jgi:hypothetical protein
MRDAVGTAALAALATLAFSAAVVASPGAALAGPSQDGASAHPAFGYGAGYGPDMIVPAAPALWVHREVYDEDGNLIGRKLVNLLG